MEAGRYQQTVVPTDRTLEDALAAGAAELDQGTFEVAAKAAEFSAEQKSNLADKYTVFSTELLANCKKFGDSIPRRYVSVISSSGASQSYLENIGYRMAY